MDRVLSILLVALSLTVSAYGFLDYIKNYHKHFGIPAAARRKQLEDALLANIVSGRIVRGDVAPQNAYPFLGGLLITLAYGAGSSLCGSSLISDSRLVTAAHCWADAYNIGEQVEVVLGSQFIYYGGTRIRSNAVVTHPYWSPNNLENDVAIIYLPVNIFFSEYIHPVNLPLYNLWDDFVGQWAIAAGYGETSDYNFNPNPILNHVNLQVISMPDCQSAFGMLVTGKNICTSGYGGVGVCRGDSGGPLIVYINGEATLIGISSFISQFGCEAGYPSVFTRVTSFMDFIMQ